MTRIERLRAECERLRELAHEAPMNKIYETHKGDKFLGTHSTAWAARSAEWMRAKNELEQLEAST